MRSTPANGRQAGKLIATKVKTTKAEEMGSVNDRIIDEKGQVLAIVVGVGGFLGMGEKDVTIGWGDVTKSSSPDKNVRQINVTRESLMSAPEFKRDD